MATTSQPETGSKVSPVKRAWWKECSVYQIYPSSFKDSNGDGTGDIPGVIEKLDYIARLGVDIVWLCPVYQSPQIDMGYDISDYKEIHEPYGTMDDVDRLIAGLHQRGLRFLMDLVVNHISDQHEWFKASKSSTASAYRDWYIWRSPTYDRNGNRCPPNNWRSYFGGSAWEYHPASGEYYLHLFAVEQPDLNWENLSVRQAVHDIMRFWLDKGVDGFRRALHPMDVINFISKAPGLPNATVSDPSSKYQHGCEHYANGPRLHKYLQQIGSLMNEYNVFSVGEMPWVNEPEEIIKSVGFDRAELNMIFNFDIVDMDHGSKGKFSPKQWSMSDLKAITNKWQSFMHQNDGWNALYLENHDQSRTVSRWGSDKPKFRNVAARMFATFLGLQSGTPFLYQGQELGMSNIPEDWEMTEYRDLETLNHWKKIIASHADDVHLLETTKQQYRLKSRDNARTPMQWDSSVHAGFTTGKPWMHVNNNYPTCNAAAQVGDPTSVFEHWAHILRLRKDHRDVLVYGNFSLVDAQNEDVFAYTRRFGEQTILVVANFREGQARWTMPERVDVKEELLLVSNYPDLRVEGREIVLRPFEAFACRRGSIRAQRL